MINWLKPVAVTAALGLALSGCAGLITGGDAELYDLNPVTGYSGELAQSPARLLIEEPIAKRALDTDRMPVRPTAQEYQYLADARFADRVPSLMQSLLVESFENANALKSVARTALGLQGDYVIKAEIRAFEAGFYEDEDRPTVRTRMAVTLVRLPALSIVKSKVFEASAKADGNETSQIVATYDMAAQMLIGEVVKWGLGVMAADFKAP